MTKSKKPPPKAEGETGPDAHDVQVVMPATISLAHLIALVNCASLGAGMVSRAPVEMLEELDTASAAGLARLGEPEVWQAFLDDLQQRGLAAMKQRGVTGITATRYVAEVSDPPAPPPSPAQRRTLH